MRIAYCGIDALCGCLELLHKRAEIVRLFTYSNDPYDEITEICDFASKNGIPLSRSPITDADISALEQEGVELMVVGGYGKKIPVSDKIRQVNIHPSLLPIGRGAWPIPVSILKNRGAGVTLHKLSEKFDLGDILLQEKIELAPNETLDTLTDKVSALSEELLLRFISDPEPYWQNAAAQEGGEYWDEPSDGDRTLGKADPAERAALLSRAFGSYGVLYQNENGGRYILVNPTVSAEKCDGALPLSDGWLVGEKKLYFSRISITDRDRIEAIRASCHPRLSDYTFSMIYCWKKDMHLTVYCEDELYCVKADDYFFAPVGKMESVKEFLHQLRSEYDGITLKFCDQTVADALAEMFPSECTAEQSPDDSDYIISYDRLCNLPGSDLSSRRNAVNHYSRVIPRPIVEPITSENIAQLRQFAKTVEHEDAAAQQAGFSHFDELNLRGAVVKRGDEIVSFCTVVEQDGDTLQGQFLKCKDRERGAELYAMQAGVRSAGGSYRFVNMEDDMGVEGLRRFKRSLGPDIITSYTVYIKGNKG